MILVYAGRLSKKPKNMWNKHRSGKKKENEKAQVKICN